MELVTLAHATLNRIGSASTHGDGQTQRSARSQEVADEVRKRCELVLYDCGGTWRAARDLTKHAARKVRGTTRSKETP